MSVQKRLLALLIVPLTLSACPSPPVEPPSLATPISTGAAAYDPRVAVDSQGNALAVWQQSDGSVNRIFSSRLTAGTTSWQAPSIISANPTDARSPSVCFSSTNTAFVVWQQVEDGFSRVKARIQEAGSSVATTITIDAGATGAGLPKITCDGQGNAVVVWVQFAENTQNIFVNVIYANRYNATTQTWSLPRRLNEPLPPPDGGGRALEYVNLPRIGSDGQGNVLAIWEQYDGQVNRVYANRYNAQNGFWTGQVVIDTPGIASGTPVESSRYAELAVSSNGDAVAVWNQMEAAPGQPMGRIYANHFIGSSQTWQGPQAISTAGAGRPEVAIDANGNAIAVWNSGGTLENRLPAGSNVWAGPKTVAEKYRGFPNVHFDPQGNALIGLWSFPNEISSKGTSRVAFTRLPNSTSSWQDATFIHEAAMLVDLETKLRFGSNASGIGFAIWSQPESNATPSRIYVAPLQ